MFISKMGNTSHSHLLISIIILGCSVLSSNGQLFLQCPAELLTISPNGRIDFAPPSDGSGSVDASYNDAAIEGWYSLAKSFIDGVGRKDLPYEVIVPLINKTFIQPSTRIQLPSGQSDIDLSVVLQNVHPQELLLMFSDWLTPMLALTVFGIVCGVCLCISGCCFWCCRCYGKCGAKTAKKAQKTKACPMNIFVVILLLITFVLFGAVVLAYTSNEQSSLNKVQSTFNDVLDDAVDYASDTVQELFSIICQLVSSGGMASSILDDIKNVGPELIGTIEDTITEIRADNQLNLPDLDIVKKLTDNISSTSAALLRTTGDLTSSISTVITNLGSLSLSCTGTFSFTAIGLCTDVVGPVTSSARTVLTGIPGLPNVRPVLTDVQEALSMIGSDIEDDGSQFLDVLVPQVTNQLNSTFRELADTIDRYNRTFAPLVRQLLSIADIVIESRHFLPDQCPALEGLRAFNSIGLPNINIDFNLGSTRAGTTTSVNVDSGLFDLTVGYIRECLVNAGFGYIKRFDEYRHTFGLVVCSVAIVSILLVWFGILCGCIGFKRDRYPSERSSCSNCGGICLLMSVGFGFLYGFFLLGLSAIIFLLGANAQKLSQSLQGPNYDLFAQTIDDPVVRQSIQAVNNNTVVDFTDIPSISQLLRDCEQNNTALFTALNLGSILELPTGTIGGTIRSLLNITRVQSEIDSTIDIAVDTFTIDIGDLSSLVQRGVDHFENVDLSALNFTGFAAEFEQTLIRANLNGSIQELRNLSSQFVVLGHSGVASEIDDIVREFEEIRDQIVPTLIRQVNDLAGNVHGIEAAQGELLNFAGQVIIGIAERLSNISRPVLENFVNQTVRGAVYRSFGYVDQYIDHLEDQIINSVGGCQPVYGIYTKVHNAVCRDYLDGLNGFWWSLGFCAVLYIPLIIFAVLTSGFLLRRTISKNKEDYQQDYSYSMKSLW